MSAWRDKVLGACVYAAVISVAAVFLWIVGDVTLHGLARVDLAFLLEAPERAGREGGIGPILVSTASILAVCLAVSVPLGLGTGVLLAEYARGGRFGRLVRGSLDVLAGVPSIVFGLFGNAFFCVALGLGFSILSGGLTLACMVLPVLVRSIELSLRAVPDDYRMAGAALGMTRARLAQRLLLPVAAPGLAAGLMLGLGRAVAETAALVFTSGYVDRTPGSLLDSGRALSVHIYDLASNVPGGEASAYGSAFVLLVALFAVNAVAFALADRWLGRRVLA